jgi:outer membrane receptor for ferrienterochelin and colicin
MTVDILGHYNITPNIKVNAGIFNITDKQYWLAAVSHLGDSFHFCHLDRSAFSLALSLFG